MKDRSVEIETYQKLFINYIQSNDLMTFLNDNTIGVSMCIPGDMVDLYELDKALWDDLFAKMIDCSSTPILLTAKKLLKNFSEYEDSWIFTCSCNDDIYLFKLLEVYLCDNSTSVQEILLDTILNPNPSIPYDIRLRSAELLVKGATSDKVKLQSVDTQRLLNIATSFQIKVEKRISHKMMYCSSEIDHLFDVPEDILTIKTIFRKAIEYKTLESIYNVVSHLNQHLQLFHRKTTPLFFKNADEIEKLIRNTYSSTEAIEILEKDINSLFEVWRDYAVNWDQVVSEADTEYSIAELAKIALLKPEFSLPDPEWQEIKNNFFRSVLKISSGAIIGLSAGAFLAEHGARPRPSIFYIGKDAILGKACMLETNGGIVVCSNSFLGGGFIPVVIHTHKHISASDTSANSERKIIFPCVFIALKGARLPMEQAFLLEAADYIDKPYAKGIYAAKVE